MLELLQTTNLTLLSEWLVVAISFIVKINLYTNNVTL